MDFQFQQFSITQQRTPMKIGTDSVLLGAWASCGGGSGGLDIGASTGILSLMLAQRCETLHITGIEPNAEACEEARENMQRSPWANRLVCRQTPLQDFHPKRRFGLIISNPPFYLEHTQAPESGRARARHASHLPPEALVHGVDRLLADDGLFSVILPESMAIKFILLAKDRALILQRQCLVHPSENNAAHRRLMEFGRVRKEVSHETLCLRREGSWSDEYRKLTRAFYVNPG